MAITRNRRHLTLQSVADLNEWIGREREMSAVIDHHQAELMAATIGCDAPDTGKALPGLWHWCWFNDALPASKLGRDGHPKLGIFLPPVPLPRRMWAGGKIEFCNPIEIGVEHKRRSIITNIQEKTGRSGQLCIVTVEHEITRADMLCVRESQSLVYREDPKSGAIQPEPPLPPSSAEVSVQLLPDPVLMFRYSALTFNGHRIHYDVDYAQTVEGYRGLVFHAPLTATYLLKLATDMAGGAEV